MKENRFFKNWIESMLITESREVSANCNGSTANFFLLFDALFIYSQNKIYKILKKISFKNL